MDLSDYNCINCSSSGEKSKTPVYRGRKYGTIDRKSQDNDKYLDRLGRPVPTQIIKVPRMDRAYPSGQKISRTFGGPRSSYITVPAFPEDYAEDLDDTMVVSLSHFKDFSVQVSAIGSRNKIGYVSSAKPLSPQGNIVVSRSANVFSRASMMSSTPYRDASRRTDHIEDKELQSTPVEIDAEDATYNQTPKTNTRHTRPTKDRRSLMKFEPVPITRATLPGERQKRTKLQSVEMPTSYSLPRNARLSKTEDQLELGTPSSVNVKTELKHLLLTETSSPSLVKDISSKRPFSPRAQERKDYSQLYHSSKQQRRSKQTTANSDQRRNSNSSGDSKKSGETSLTTSDIRNDRNWLEESEEIISASSETLSKGNLFKLVFFEESLRRKLNLQETLQSREVH